MSQIDVELIFMGVGSSGGTPVIGCNCPACVSNDPRNQRSRCAAHIVANGVHFQIDTGPDFRAQCLREKIPRVDAVLYSHQHADHLNGIDDLRAFCYHQKAVIPVYGPDFTLQDIHKRFGYTLHEPTGHWEKPTLALQSAAMPFEVNGVTVTPIPVLHGTWPILGYRIGNVAWLTDVSDIPESSIALLQGLDVLALDCLREKPHPTHLSRQQALAWAQRLGAKTTYLIHMTHEMEYETSSRDLPDNVVMAWDGLRVKFVS